MLSIDTLSNIEPSNSLLTILDISWIAGKVPYQVYHSVTIEDSLSFDMNQCMLLLYVWSSSVSKTSFRNADVGMTMTSNQSLDICVRVYKYIRSEMKGFIYSKERWGSWISNGEWECRKVFPVEDLEEAVEVIRGL